MDSHTNKQFPEPYVEHRVSIHLEVVGSNPHKCEKQNIFFIFLVNYTIFVSC
jgi:hypothetical protein